MTWLNEYEISEIIERFDWDETPNLWDGGMTLLRLLEWTNSHSDGWPYWKKPAAAAEKLMTLLAAADRWDPADVTAAELKKTYTPIKAFLTRQGVDHREVWPPPEPPVVLIEKIKPGDTVLGGPNLIPCTVLRVEPGTETVFPLAGRPCIRLWCRASTNGHEGYLTYGPGGMVKMAP